MKRIFTILVLCIMAFAASAKNYEVSIPTCIMRHVYIDHSGFYTGIIDISEIIGTDVMLEEGDVVAITFNGVSSVVVSKVYIRIYEEADNMLNSYDDEITVETTEVNTTVDVKITRASLGNKISIEFDFETTSFSEEHITFISNWDTSAIDNNFAYEDAEKTIISKYIGNSSDVVIPNSVTSIRSDAFDIALTSIIIPDGVDVSNTIIVLFFVKDDIGYCYRVLNSNEVSVAAIWTESTVINIPSTITAGNTFSVTRIEPSFIFNVYDEGYRVTSVTIPNSVTSIGENAFGEYGRENLTSITIPNGLDVSHAGISIEKDGIVYDVLSSNEVSVHRAESSLTEINISSTITAGNTFTVTSINAGIKILKDGFYYKVLNNNEVSICGAESSLTEVTIPNSLTVGTVGIFSVTSIESNAFVGCTNLTSVTIPNTITTIGENAFSGCTALKNVTCLATVPPTAYANSFENYNGYLYIPCESADDYDFASCWGSFKHVECIGAETVELTKDEVSVVPEKTEAVFSMPKNENANTYTLTISNNGVTFCTLTFNAQGQLANIDFSTNKSYELKSGVEAFQFTVTGLSTASDYGYSFKALDNAKAVLKEYSGSFTTKNEDGTGGSVQGGGEGSDQGSQGGEGGEGGSTAISEVSNTTAVTVVNGQILVNGEAPAFVVTVSGQKIKNVNLKAGVYFVSVEGETVKVVK